jgi:hypothetical protein
MSEYSRPMDVAQAFAVLERRIAVLELSGAQPRRFTTATRPAAVTMPGAIIYNTTTAKHQGSNGSAWSDLY